MCVYVYVYVRGAVLRSCAWSTAGSEKCVTCVRKKQLPRYQSKINHCHLRRSPLLPPRAPAVLSWYGGGPNSHTQSSGTSSSATPGSLRHLSHRSHWAQVSVSSAPCPSGSNPRGCLAGWRRLVGGCHGESAGFNWSAPKIGFRDPISKTLIKWGRWVDYADPPLHRCALLFASH